MLLQDTWAVFPALRDLDLEFLIDAYLHPVWEPSGVIELLLGK